MKRVLLIFFLVLLFGLIGIVVFKNQVIKGSVEVVGSQVLGAKIRLEYFSMIFSKQKILIKGLTIDNPKGFPREDKLIEIPEVEIDFDLLSLVNKKLYFPFIHIHMAQLVVVKNKDGIMNVDALKISQRKENPDEQDDPRSSSGDIELKIDELSLKVGKVVMKDFSRGDNPVVEAFDVNFDKRYKDVNSVNQLTGLILVESMKGTTIRGAKIYAIAMFTGVGFLPAVGANVLFSEDSARALFHESVDTVYETAVSTIRSMGQLKSENREKGVVRGNVQGASIAIKIREKEGQPELTVSARKMMLPKPKIAQGVLYEIQNALK
ncbi:MAG: AsmA family protein [Candidatus Omnitrophica bacterium]|nr:AsmA family protein [Candidatus Omnitrophota bacterium]